jgi:hypothetical protein
MEVMMRSGQRLACVAAFAALLFTQLSGCASIAEGVTRGLVGDTDEATDEGACEVVGPAFPGLDASLLHQEQAVDTGAGRRALKVLMVHGIGEHEPGYSGLLQQNLARALGLSKRDEIAKRIEQVSPEAFPGQSMGTLVVTRYRSADDAHQLLFYELTWSGIIAQEKALLAYDLVGEHASRRAGINDAVKRFANSHIPDPLIYLGAKQQRIQHSVGVALCWVLSKNWADLSDDGPGYCSVDDPDFLSRVLKDDFAFVSHSLGSRIVIDALAWIAEIGGSATDDLEPVALERWRGMQEMSFPVFMLSNQLLLLQLGRAKPEVTRQFDDYCYANSPKYTQRQFKGVTLVAFTDPNDILSYAVPPSFTDEYMDSRLCPSMANVLVNVAPVTSILGLGEFANPLRAHSGYIDDARVVGLIAQGVGLDDGTASIVTERCNWLETVRASR